ncbi:hypothetical protein BDB00DRAFT_857051 [Zychaea mexicana]|uniref:uncharacterized protein n=1 Tax=Zychaea mexicana TaxID=64656 RepID=UPI0022FF3D58|nr:uncharacterized protein BDB00DRAFT_857051 [Zychaea mexicana]KAI9482603.1 hypothetical protein BDB00DRAFT_857051 [Zychaea mexicana]
MLKQIPTPSPDDLRTALGPDYASDFDQDKVTCWLQEKGWGHIASTFQDHDIHGEEFFNITLAKLVEILPRQVTTYAERRRLLNDIRALGTPAVLDGQLSPLAAPANISINTNVHPSYGNRSPSIPSAGTPTSSGQLASSNSPTTPLSASRCDCHSSSAHAHLMDHAKEGSGISFISRHNSPSPSPSSSEFPSSTTTTNNNSSTTPVHSRASRQSPTRYSPKVAFSKFRNTFLYSSSGSTQQHHHHHHSHHNHHHHHHHQQQQQQPQNQIPSQIPSSSSTTTQSFSLSPSLTPSSCTTSTTPITTPTTGTTSNNHTCATTPSPPPGQQPLISPRTSSMNYDAAAFDAETEERMKQHHHHHHHHHYTSKFSSTPDKLSKIWAAYSNWRSPTSHRTSKGHQQQQHASATTATSSTSPTSSSSSSGVTTTTPLPSDNGATTTTSTKAPPNKSALGLATHKRFTEQRIQVTSDKETWYSVVVTDIRDPECLKDRILKRLDVQGNRDEFYYFHENGPDPETPLASQDIMYLCSIADHSANQHILVCFAPNYQHPSTAGLVRQQQQQQQQQPPYTENRYLRAIDTHQYYDHQQQQPPSAAFYGNSAYSLSTPELGHSPSDTPSSPHLNTTHKSHSPVSAGDGGLQESSPFIFPSKVCRHSSREILRASPYDEPVGVQLSDPPTPCQPEDMYEHPTQPHASESSDIKYQRQRTGSVPYIHEPHLTANSTVNHDDPRWTRRSEPTFDHRTRRPIHPGGEGSSSASSSSGSSNGSGLWAVPPRTSCPNLAETHQRHQLQQQHRPTAQLWAVAPSTVHPLQRNDGTMHDGSSDDASTRTSSTPPASPREFWGERPPAEVVCQNMDKYFDNHDLDKEIVVGGQLQQPVPLQQQRPQQQQPINRRLTHTKSIRIVAREASKKYNRARKASAKGGSILRRKSTKLWGQRVVEVKPKEQLQLVREQEYSMNMSHNGSTTHDGQSVQWIRGKLIGKGSFGRVYLAFNVATGEVIAVKQVEIPKTKSDLLDSHQHDMVDALYQEIAMLRDLDHDNIVQYLGYGRDDSEGVVNIFLEYVSGGSISSRLALHGAFEEPLVRHFTRQICMGIEYLHSRSILHRDIKAANILVEGDGVCKISDFGLSKKNDYDEVYDQNSRMSLRGSVYWMAPEVVKNEPYSAKVDIWSLGCTVIEMFTGQRPWLTLNQIATLYNLGCQKSPDVPEDMSDVGKDFLRQCFQIDPSKRPTAAQLLSHPFCVPDPTFEFTDYVNKGKV